MHDWYETGGYNQYAVKPDSCGPSNGIDLLCTSTIPGFNSTIQFLAFRLRSLEPCSNVRTGKCCGIG